MSSVDLYRFDASVAGPTDSSSGWSNDANAFDSSESTFATSDGTAGRVLSGEGTTAPTSGDPINQVRFRIRTVSAFSSEEIGAEIWDGGVGGTSLLVVNDILYTDPAEWSIFYNLPAPSGGWTWQKLSDLSVGFEDLDNRAQEIHMAQIEVSSGHLSHIYAEQDKDVTTNSTSFTDVDNTSNTTQLSVAGSDLKPNTKYLLVGRALAHKINGTTSKNGIRIVTSDDSTISEVSDSFYEQASAGNVSGKSWFFAQSYETSSSPSDVTFECRSTGGDTGAISLKSIMLLDLGEIGYHDSFYDGGAETRTGDILGGSGVNEEAAIRFTPTGDGDLEWIDARMEKTSSPTDNFNVEIRSGSASGTLLATSDNVAASGVPASVDWVRATFSSPPTLTKGTEYYAVYQRTGSRDASNFVSFYAANADTGAGLVQTRDSGSWGDESGRWGQVRYHSVGGYLEDKVAPTGIEVDLSPGVLATIDGADLGTTEEWLVLGSVKIHIGSTGRWYQVGMNVASDSSSTSEEHSDREEGQDTAEERMNGFIARHKASSGTPNIEITGWEEAGSGNMTMEGAYIIAIPFSYFEDVEYDFTPSSITLSGATTIASVGPYTPSIGGQHWIMGRDHKETPDNNDMRMYVLDGSTEIRDIDNVPFHNQIWDAAKDMETAFTMSRYYSATSKTFNLVAGSTGTIDERGLWVINLARPALSGDTFETITDDADVTDNVSRVAPAERTVTDDADVTDSTPHALTIIRSVTEAVGVIDLAVDDLTQVTVETEIRPVSDDVAAGWDTAPTGSQDLWVQLDEETPSDTDYIFTESP